MPKYSTFGCALFHFYLYLLYRLYDFINTFYGEYTYIQSLKILLLFWPELVFFAPTSTLWSEYCKLLLVVSYCWHKTWIEYGHRDVRKWPVTGVVRCFSVCNTNTLVELKPDYGSESDEKRNSSSESKFYKQLEYADSVRYWFTLPQLVKSYIPPNQKNQFTTSQFLQDRVASSGDQLSIGDLNFYLDKKNDTATRKLTDLLESFNILQFVNTSTHMSGHTLGVIMCRDTDNLI